MDEICVVPNPLLIESRKYIWINGVGLPAGVVNGTEIRTSLLSVKVMLPLTAPEFTVLMVIVVPDMAIIFVPIATPVAAETLIPMYKPVALATVIVLADMVPVAVVVLLLLVKLL